MIRHNASTPSSLHVNGSLSFFLVQDVCNQKRFESVEWKKKIVTRVARPLSNSRGTVLQIISVGWLLWETYNDCRCEVWDASIPVTHIHGHFNRWQHSRSFLEGWLSKTSDSFTFVPYVVCYSISGFFTVPLLAYHTDHSKTVSHGQWPDASLEGKKSSVIKAVFV